MAVEVTYAQYVEDGGTLSEAVFNSLLPKATATVDYLIGINQVTDEGKYRQAVYASLDSFATTGIAGNGFAIGSFRMDEREDAKTPEQVATEAAYQVLATTGMVYGGIA